MEDNRRDTSSEDENLEIEDDEVRSSADFN